MVFSPRKARESLEIVQGELGAQETVRSFLGRKASHAALGRQVRVHLIAFVDIEGAFDDEGTAAKLEGVGVEQVVLVAKAFRVGDLEREVLVRMSGEVVEVDPVVVRNQVPFDLSAADQHVL